MWVSDVTECLSKWRVRRREPSGSIKLDHQPPVESLTDLHRGYRSAARLCYRVSLCLTLNDVVSTDGHRYSNCVARCLIKLHQLRKSCDMRTTINGKYRIMWNFNGFLSGTEVIERQNYGNVIVNCE
jgi:hypothetical protein